MYLWLLPQHPWLHADIHTVMTMSTTMHTIMSTKRSIHKRYIRTLIITKNIRMQSLLTKSIHTLIPKDALPLAKNSRVRLILK